MIKEDLDKNLILKPAITAQLTAFTPTYLKQQLLGFICSKKLWLMAMILVLGAVSYYSVYQPYVAQQQTRAIVAAPKINDIYFFDFRLLRDNLRPTEKYRLAKVVDITGDIVSLVYGSFYYQHQHAAINSIYYGQLSYKDYFEPKRFDYRLPQIQQKFSAGALYLAMRPEHDKLLGQRVSPEQRKFRTNAFIQGRKENSYGEALLLELHSETNLQQAFVLFSQSANYNFAQGQVNLAQMYINGQFVEKDLNKALYWLNQAALQSHKAAILKYEIICRQVPACQPYDFFKNLKSQGVDVKVRQLTPKFTIDN